MDASEHSWFEFVQIKNDYDLNSIKSLINSLKSLLNNNCLQNEYQILFSVSKRIAIRLRSAKVTRLIKHTKKCWNQFIDLQISDVMTENMSSLLNENYDITSGCILLPFRQQIDSVLKVFVKSAPILKKLILISINAFSHCHQWLRSGNLAPHFLMMSSCLSRFNYISKAILVYINDIYSLLIGFRDVLKEKQLIFKEINSFPESLEEFLIDCNIKCEKKVVKKIDEIFNDINDDNVEDIGVSIERIGSETQKFDNRLSNESKGKKKKKNKNKLSFEPKPQVFCKIKSRKQNNLKKSKK